MLEVSGLVVTYGGSVRALRGVSLNVPEGGVAAVLGSNGAGKTTLLRAISGTLSLHGGRVERGSIAFEGADITRMATSEIVRRGIVCVPEGRRIFAHLTVEDNLRAGGIGNRDAAGRERAHRRVLEMFPVLGERRSQRGGLLSGGEQQMLALGRALMAEPRLLLLDEPSLGLAPLMVARVRETVQAINAAGTAVLLIEQNAAMALALAGHAAVLEVGTVSLQGPAAELAASDRVRELYLGAGASASARVARAPRASLARWIA
jgi:branched-chain amino acid transport system ATP-binding protein